MTLTRPKQPDEHRVCNSKKFLRCQESKFLNSKKAPNDLNIRESKNVAYLTEQKRCAQTLVENLMGAQNKRLSGIEFWH